MTTGVLLGVYFGRAYSPEQVSALSMYGLSLNTPAGLRHRAMQLLTHCGILNPKDCRGLRLADVQYIGLANESAPESGSDWCPVLVMQLHQGRCYKTGTQQIVGAMRAKEWSQCALGALAFWLFYRFHLSGQTFTSDGAPFPNIADAQDWYDLLLFPASDTDLKKQMSGVAYASVIKKTLHALGLPPLKETKHEPGPYAPPGPVVQKAERKDPIAYEKSCRDCLERERMRALAQWDERPGSFNVERDEPVPEALLARVFPDAEAWANKMQSTNRARSKTDVYAHGFLKLLHHLRTILIQDAIELQDHQPDHFLLQHEVFQSADFLSFREVVRERKAARQREARAREDAFTMMQESGIFELLRTMQRTIENYEQRYAEANDLFMGILRRMLDRNQSQASAHAALMAALAATTSPSSSSSSSAFAPIAPSSSRQQDTASQTAPAPAAAAPAPATSSPAAFKMDRSLRSVKYAWAEYAHGLRGQPALSTLYAGPDKSWKKDASERRYYAQRMVIINEVIRLAEGAGVGPEVIVDQLDNVRTKKRWSLRQLREGIKKGEVRISLE